MIERWPGTVDGRSRAVTHQQLGWIVATASDATAPLAVQIESTLDNLDLRLHEIGSSRLTLLSVQVFLSALTDKPQFDEAWEPWIGANPAHWPQRVCVGVALSGGLRIELAAVALRSASGNEGQISQRSLR